jgi:hypothetical protein
MVSGSLYRMINRVSVLENLDGALFASGVLTLRRFADLYKGEMFFS